MLNKTILGLFIPMMLINCNQINKKKSSGSDLESEQTQQTNPNKSIFDSIRNYGRGIEEGKHPKKQKARPNDEKNDNQTSYNESDIDEEKPQNYNWYCGWCGKIIQKNTEPYHGDNGSCRGALIPRSYADKNQKNRNGWHHWNMLGKVGNNQYECRNCGVSIYLDEIPGYGRKGRCDLTDQKKNCQNCGHDWRLINY